MKNIFNLKTGILLAGAFALSGCDQSPDQSITDNFVQKLMAATDDDQTLLGQYHVMRNNEGEDIGIIFVKEVTSGENYDCIKYISFTSGTFKSAESQYKTACIPHGLTLGN